MTDTSASYFPFKTLPQGLLAIAILTILSYLPITQAGFIWDDDEYITGNPTVLTKAGIEKIWLEPGACPYYYPTTFSVFWLENQLWGTHPLGYHLVNLALHVLNAFLLVLVLVSLRLPGAVLAGLVFSLHPVQVASVAWATELKNILSAMFSFAALFLWLEDRSRLGLKYGMALLLFLLGMLAKPVVCSFPVVLLVLVWWKNEQAWKRRLLSTLPFFGLSLAVSLFTLYWESQHKLVSDGVYDLTFLQRALLATQSLCFYGLKLLWPHPLLAIYPQWVIDSGSMVSLVPAIILLGLSLVFWSQRHRVGKGPLVALFSIIVVLAPISGVLNFSGMVYSHVFTHHLYHATAVFGAVLGASLYYFAEWMRLRGFFLSRWVPIIAVAATFSTLTWNQAAVYQSERDLFAYNIAVTPHSPQARVFYGNALMAEGNLAPAIEQYQKAIDLSPRSARAHFRMAEAQARLGNSDRALLHLEKAVQSGPDDSRARFNLAWAYLNRQDYSQAEKHFTHLIRTRPSYWSAYLPLAESLLAQGREEEAIETLKSVLEIRPDYSQAEYRLAILLVRRGDFVMANDHFQKALSLSPDSGFKMKPEFTREMVRLARRLHRDREDGTARKVLARAQQIWPRLSELQLALKELQADPNKNRPSDGKSKPRLPD